MAVSQEKITVYNLAGKLLGGPPLTSHRSVPSNPSLTSPALLSPDLKNTSDDAIPNYLNSLSFRQSHHLTDVRLALGYSAFLLAGACFLWDYKLGFDSTKYLTAAAVAVYTLLNGALTLWILYVERGTVYEGTAPSGETVRISTSTKKNVPTYYMTIEIGHKDGKKEKLEVSRAFTEWFDAVGHFVAAPFQTVLATAVPLIGKLDPKRVASAAEGKADAAPAYTPEMLAMLAEANVSAVGSAAETAASGAESSGKKGGKRRKA
ncbi:Signal peptidase complex subunit SPC2 [Madurella mycetomatis]|uniref:Signal peptidase complex subunit 2 n=1 Tax=Madurella mycetomatis TaxID=100816 RepID=A0A175VPF9_9PEZI|nr:Signal peptidase complex subunit SPC2 [Madurella mycetomatis]